jgi:hypothetical protein
MTRTVVIAVYLVIVAGMVLTDVIARSRPDRIAPVDDMLEKAMISRTARIGIIAAWWWFGWHFIFATTVDPMEVQP